MTTGIGVLGEVLVEPYQHDGRGLGDELGTVVEVEAVACVRGADQAWLDRGDVAPDGGPRLSDASLDKPTRAHPRGLLRWQEERDDRAALQLVRGDDFARAADVGRKPHRPGEE